MNEKVIMSGNEAIARGAYEAGVGFASAYPGTPSTEILENMPQYKDIDSRWANNEKVALEMACGAQAGGLRTLTCMKHVGLNVAADPLMTIAYIGTNGGMLVVTADDPGMHSSQNEQDNRYYSKLGKLIMMSKKIAAEKGYDCPYCGDFDCVIVPTMAAGNLMHKAMIICGGTKMAGVVVGAKVPVVLTSRGASTEEKFVSLALASLIS